MTILPPSIAALDIQRQAQFVRDFCENRKPTHEGIPITAPMVRAILENETVRTKVEPTVLTAFNRRVTLINDQLGFEFISLISTATQVAAAAIISFETIASVFKQNAIHIQQTMVGDSAGFGNEIIGRCRNTEQLKGCLDEIIDALKSGQFRGQPMLISNVTIFTILTAVAMLECRKKHLMGTDPFINECIKLYLRYNDPLIDPNPDKRLHENAVVASIAVTLPYLIRENMVLGDDVSIGDAIKLRGLEPLFTQRSFDRESQGAGAAVRTGILALLKEFGIVETEEDFLEVILTNAITTHPNPIGFLGGLISPLLIREALNNQPIGYWPLRICEAIAWESKIREIAKSHIVLLEWENEYFHLDWLAVLRKWEQYRDQINVHPDTFSGHEEMRFIYALPSRWSPKSKEAFDQQIRSPLNMQTACPGEKGHDAPLLAYHAVYTVCQRLAKYLGKDFDRITTTPKIIRLWLNEYPECIELTNRWLIDIACLHGGDSNATGAIAFQLWGAIANEYAASKNLVQNAERIPAQDLLSEEMQVCHFRTIEEKQPRRTLTSPSAQASREVAADAFAIERPPIIESIYDFSAEVRTSVMKTLQNIAPDAIDPNLMIAFNENTMFIYCVNLLLAEKLKEALEIPFIFEGIFTFQIQTDSRKFWNLMRSSGFQLDLAVSADPKRIPVEYYLTHYGVLNIFRMEAAALKAPGILAAGWSFILIEKLQKILSYTDEMRTQTPLLIYQEERKILSIHVVLGDNQLFEKLRHQLAPLKGIVIFQQIGGMYYQYRFDLPNHDPLILQEQLEKLGVVYGMRLNHTGGITIGECIRREFK